MVVLCMQGNMNITGHHELTGLFATLGKQCEIIIITQYTISGDCDLQQCNGFMKILYNDRYLRKQSF